MVDSRGVSDASRPGSRVPWEGLEVEVAPGPCTWNVAQVTLLPVGDHFDPFRGC